MTDIKHLIQDLRADAHRVPPEIGANMREAADVLDRYKNMLSMAQDGAEAEVRSVPIPPPPLPRRHRRPARSLAE